MSKTELSNKMQQAILSKCVVSNKGTGDKYAAEQCADIAIKHSEAKYSIDVEKYHKIKNDLADNLEDYEYKLKSDAELIDDISKFGLGETEFNTADIERLIKEKQYLENLFLNKQS
jgi:hypothetical protein